MLIQVAKTQTRLHKRKFHHFLLYIKVWIPLIPAVHESIQLLCVFRLHGLSSLWEGLGIQIPFWARVPISYGHMSLHLLAKSDSIASQKGNRILIFSSITN
jgi:hypothetical protein